MKIENSNDSEISVRYVGKKPKMPSTSLPPLGKEWDQKMEMAYRLSKSGKKMKFFIGCFKSVSSKNGVMKNG